MRFNLRDYQIKAVEDLSNAIKWQWKSKAYHRNIYFQSPTGSGKTVIMAELIKRLESDFLLKDKKAFLWVTFNETLYQQSKNNIDAYTNGTLILKDHSDLDFRNELKNNEIFFINWQKIKSTSKENRKLRQNTERSPSGLGLFDHYIKETQNKDTDFIMIIDESHIGSQTVLAQEIIDSIKPRIIIKVSATIGNIEEEEHEHNNIKVSIDDVKESGLLKHNIIIQTKEEIKGIDGIEQVHLLIKLSYDKRVYWFSVKCIKWMPSIVIF